MADTNVTAGATGSYFISIDSDNDSNSQLFQLVKHVASTPVPLFEVKESSEAIVHQYSGAGFFVQVPSGGGGLGILVRHGSTTRAQIGEDGVADFSYGGVRTKSGAGAPAGGNAGALYVDSTNNRLYVKVGATWKYTNLI